MAFTHTLNPTLFEIGPFEVRFYGMVYAFGFLLIYYMLSRAVKQKKLDVKLSDVDSLVLYLIAGVIIGARLFHVVFWEPMYYLQHPIQSLMIWQGGLAFHGGLLGAIVVTVLFARRKKVSVLQLADILVVPASLALSLGRIANFWNGELWGILTNAPWCVNFPRADGCRHPVQLYAAAARFVIFGYLFNASKRAWKRGTLFWHFMFLMNGARIVVDFFREDYRLFGLTPGQYLSIFFILATAIVMYHHTKKNGAEKEPTHSGN